MTNLIPSWIAKALEEDRTGGQFPALCLFLDISGFTAMTEALMVHGKDGAESLSKVINEVFNPVLMEIEAAGGFVTTFAGDALTALIPAESPELPRLQHLALRILWTFQRHPDRRTPWGDFVLQAKVGLSQGPVDWGILGTDDHLGYFFRGPAVTAAAQAEHACDPGTLAWADGLPLAPPEGARQVTKKAGHTVVQPGTLSLPELPPLSPHFLEKGVVARFLPVEDFPRFAGEFRNLTSVFVLFDEGTRTPEEIHAVLTQHARENAGFFHLLDFGDKGGVALVLFGAPVSLESNLTRACDFALAVVGTLPEVRVGVARGQCFAGYVGSSFRLTYTALGQVVNLAARLAGSAVPGEVLLPSGSLAEAGRDYQAVSIGERVFKGIARPVELSRVVGKREVIPRFDLAPGVARRSEIERVTQWLHSVSERRRSGMFLIRGEAGMGKTQLASDAFREMGPELDYQILRCDPVFSTGFHPFRGVYTSLLGPSILSSGDPEAAARALGDALVDAQTPDYLEHEIRRAGAALLTLAGRRPQDPEWDHLDPQARHDRTVEALVAHWSLRAQAAPCFLVVENAQALDAETKEVLERLVSRATDQPLGVLLLSRGPVPLDLPAGTAPPVILEPFTKDETELLVKQRLGKAPSARLVEILSRRTSQIPLYLSELLRYLRERGLVRIASEVDFEGDEESGLPGSLEDLILSQVDHLPAALKGALPALSVLGNSFSSEVARDLLGEGAEATLEMAVAHGVLRQGTLDTLRFQKESLRETVYQLQLGDLLRTLHRRSGDAFERIYPEPQAAATEKAYHFDRAQEWDKAKGYFRFSAETAAEDFRNTEALRALDRFLDLSQDQRENCGVRLKKAQILEHVGDWKAARVEIERGVGLAALSGLEDQFHKFLGFLGQIQFKQGDTDGARSSFERAISDPRIVDPGPEPIQSRIDLARVHLLLGQYDEALRHLKEAGDLAVAQGFAEQEGLALYYLGVVYRVRNRKAEAHSTYQKALQIFRQLGLDRLITYPLYDLSLMFQHEGDLDQAKAHMEEAYRIYTQIGYKSGLAAALLNLGAIEDQHGSFDAAMDAFRRSKNITEELGEDLGTAYALFSLGASAYKQREYARALVTLKEAHAMIERLGAESYKGYTLSYLASVLVKLQRGDEALATVRLQGEVIAKTGDDVERGRALLAVADVLAARLPLSRTGRADLEQIVVMTQAPRISAAWFYQAAIRAAQEANYINTLIPATYEYGKYLISKGRADQGAVAIRQAWVRARRGGWRSYTRRLESKHQELLAKRPRELV